MAEKISYEIGMIGLGVMGRNLLLNMADHGFCVAGYDKDLHQVDHLRQASQARNIYGTTDLKAFIDCLRRPRAIIMLVPAGSAVDAVIESLLPYLHAGDLMIDAGNSYFKDTDVRARYLSAKNIQFMGMGISGGEEGARHGPSIMPGGSKEAYERVRPVLEAVSAKVNGDSCVTYVGAGSSGHFVKMVHNGIEYALMQLIAETYDLIKRNLQWHNTQLSQLYADWNKGEVSSYLIEITSQIFNQKDDKTGEYLIDKISATAGQKGTGMWTSQSAMELQVPTPGIDLAVAMRDLSVFAKERHQVSEMYPQPGLNNTVEDQKLFLSQLHGAFFASMIIIYAQGMALLSAASDKYHYGLNLEAIAKIWRGGCIIRAKLLEDIAAAFSAKRDLSNLLLDPQLSHKLKAHQKSLRQIVCHAAINGVPVPALMVSLSYLDAYRSVCLPANLIQAQRDYFGAHTYERIDMPGVFHTEWEKTE